MELKYFGLGRGHTNTNVGVEFGQRRMRNSHNPACWFVVRLRDQQHTSLLLAVAAFLPVSVHQCQTHTKRRCRLVLQVDAHIFEGGLHSHRSV